MNSILVLAPHEDRASRAARLAGELAERIGARVVLLRVLEERLGSGGTQDSSDAQQQVRELLLEAETQQAEALGEELRDRGIDVSVEVCWGVAWEAVLERVERDGHDLVVKPASGLVRQGHVFFGSTALHLFRKCPCPVWVVGNDARPPQKLLAAIDPSGAERRRQIAANILEWTDLVADWSGGEVHLGTAWNAAGEGLLKERLAEAEWKRYVDEAHERTSDALASTLEENRRFVPAERLHLVEGVAHEALAQLAHDESIDLIVMGTLGREDAIGDHLGETAETVIRQVRCSVLTIPPGVRPPQR